MSSEKSVAIITPRKQRLCPVCGTACYSAGGIHPQCAVSQADEPRMVRLRAEKAAEKKIIKPVRRTGQKKCAACGKSLDVRRAVCPCGHKVGSRS